MNNNTNNNNNNNNNSDETASRPTTDEQSHLLEFHLFDVSHKRTLTLTSDPEDQRLIIFHETSSRLNAIGIRNGE